MANTKDDKAKTDRALANERGDASASDKSTASRRDAEFAREKAGFINPKNPALGKTGQGQKPTDGTNIDPDPQPGVDRDAEREYRTRHNEKPPGMRPDVNEDNARSSSGVRAYPAGGQSPGLRQQPGRPDQSGVYHNDDTGRSGVAGADTKRDYKEEDRHLGRPDKDEAQKSSDPTDSKY